MWWDGMQPKVGSQQWWCVLVIGACLAVVAKSTYSSNATLGTTNPSIPKLFQKELLKYGPISEGHEDFFVAGDAVSKLEAKVGWNADTSNFVESDPLGDIQAKGLQPPMTIERDAQGTAVINGRPISDMIDIVVPSIRDLTFLEDWRLFIEPFHLIIIQDGDPNKQLKIPDWADYVLYNRADINRTLGDNAWIISSRDASIRNFGFLVSDKDYIYTLDDDCLPATHPVTGKKVNAIEEHLLHLLTPATPFFFNTVYDAFRDGVDFVRGYPYSLRAGVSTAISHGLWMNAYDYDAPTQLLKVHERNTRYHDLSQTIPKGVLYPMCSMNVAFNKKLIGPAFMQGLMGDGQPWARYDDMFAGWASKVIADHLRLGVKSGAPYIHHNKASNPFTNLKKEYRGLFWQEQIISFMQTVTLSSASNTAAKAYVELAGHIDKALTPLHPYFHRLAQAMKLWVHEWERRFGLNSGEYDCYDPDQTQRYRLDPMCLPAKVPVASRSSWRKHVHVPGGNDSGGETTQKTPPSTCAVFTIVHNEQRYLPIWLRYYLRHVPPEDIWILDHNTNDGSTNPDVLPRGVHVRKVYGEAAWMPHHFLNRQVELHMQRLLAAGYPCVVFVEIDEFLAPDPEKYPGGLREYLQRYAENAQGPLSVLATGYQVLHVSQGQEHVEPAVVWTEQLLQNRRYWVADTLYNKPVITKVPFRYTAGHHSGANREGSLVGDAALYLIHTHYIDSVTCNAHEEQKFLASKARSKANERRFGLNNFNNRERYEDIATFETVCCLAMASVANGQAKVPCPLSHQKGNISVIPDVVRTTVVI
eukprot:gene7777-5595_t